MCQPLQTCGSRTTHGTDRCMIMTVKADSMTCDTSTLVWLPCGFTCIPIGLWPSSIGRSAGVYAAGAKVGSWGCPVPGLPMGQPEIFYRWLSDACKAMTDIWGNYSGHLSVSCLYFLFQTISHRAILFFFSHVSGIVMSKDSGSRAFRWRRWGLVVDLDWPFVWRKPSQINYVILLEQSLLVF
jgi:hypothetical protein